MWIFLQAIAALVAYDALKQAIKFFFYVWHEMTNAQEAKQQPVAPTASKPSDTTFVQAPRRYIPVGE